jgi:hypothetical protein
MIRRVNAFKTIFNFLLSIVELLIGLCFLIKMFGSFDAAGGLLETVDQVLEQMGYVASAAIDSSDISGPVAFLVLVLCFMVFSFVLIAIAPNLAEKIEEDVEEFD